MFSPQFCVFDARQVELFVIRVIRPGKAIASGISEGTRWRQTIRGGVKPASHGLHACPVGQVPLKGFPIRSGRSLLTTDPVPTLSNPRTGVKGTLLWKGPYLGELPATEQFGGTAGHFGLETPIVLLQSAPWLKNIWGSLDGPRGCWEPFRQNRTHVMRLERFCVF